MSSFSSSTVTPMRRGEFRSTWRLAGRVFRVLQSSPRCNPKCSTPASRTLLRSVKHVFYQGLRDGSIVDVNVRGVFLSSLVFRSEAIYCQQFLHDMANPAYYDEGPVNILILNPHCFSRPYVGDWHTFEAVAVQRMRYCIRQCSSSLPAHRVNWVLEVIAHREFLNDYYLADWVVDPRTSEVLYSSSRTSR